MGWNGEAAKERIRRRAAQVLLALATELESEHKRDLSTSFPPASRPGEYPHGRTWNLRENVTHEPQTVEQVAEEGEVRVGYGIAARYIVRLADLRRKTIIDTLDRIRTRLRAMSEGLKGNAGDRG